MRSYARSLLGVLVKDVPLYVAALARGGNGWLAIRNRDEVLEPAPAGEGFRCDWQWTSDLHAPKVVPALGRRLMRRAMAAHPIRRAAAPPGGEAEVSFVIGHRGAARAPHLLATLETIAAQRDVRVECVVVEQDVESTLRLPPWVRHVHTPVAAGVAYNRSAAFNAGAQQARAPILVLHDNDLLVPADYAAQLRARVAQGFEVVNLKRFIFYLDPAHSRGYLQGSLGVLDRAPTAIVQNNEGGGSIAITRAAFDTIGGMDESFVGWGGEDNEFWERALTRVVWPWANLPLVHLWHEAQPGKTDGATAATARYRELARIDPRERIQRLRAREGL